ncbi:MAG: hypothetical protein AAFV71_29425 [Cyanobacteria bacterium J06633_8]
MLQLILILFAKLNHHNSFNVKSILYRISHPAQPSAETPSTEGNMNQKEKLIWLQERTALGILETEPLEAIAKIIEEKVIPANQLLVKEETFASTEGGY